MKIHKKEIAVLLAVVMLLGCTLHPVQIRAAEDTKGKIELTHTNLSSMNAGTQFQVKIRIYDMDSFTGLTGTLTYDGNLVGVSTGSAISVSTQPSTTGKNASKWEAGMEEKTDGTNLLEVKWTDSANAPTAAELVVTIPFVLKTDCTSQKLSFQLTGVTVYTDTSDDTKKYDLPEANISQITIQSQKLGFELGTPTGSEEIHIPIRITENTGVTGFTITVSCKDAAQKGLLRYYPKKQSFTNGAKGKYFVQNHKWENGTLTLDIIPEGAIQETNPYTGDFYDLVLDSSRPVQQNITVGLTVAVTKVSHQENDVPFIVPPAQEITITLKPLNYTLGHVKNPQGTGKVTLMDVLWLIRVYRNDPDIDPLDEAQRKAADVNGDGEINDIDALWILECFNGDRDENFEKVKTK